MAIISSGVWPIDPTVTDGTQLAGYLNELITAINTNQSSATRPPMIRKGGMWTKTLSGSDIAVMVYDGTTDYEIGKIVGGDIQLDSIWTESGDVATYDGKVVVGNASWVGGGTTGLGIQASSNSSSPFAFYIKNSDDTLLTSVRCNGDTNINGKVVYDQDMTVNGVTVGKGSGTGDQNTVVGTGALSSATTGGYNVAVGRYALKNNQVGVNNVAVGTNSLQNVKGNNNTAIGHSNGQTLTSGANNTLIGVGAEPSSPTVSNEVTIGNDDVTKTRLRGVVDIGKETNDTARVDIKSSYEGHIMFGDSASSTEGRITYNHNENSINLFAGNTKALVCSGDAVSILPTFFVKLTSDISRVPNMVVTETGQVRKSTAVMYSAEEVDKKLAIKDKMIESLSEKLEKLEDILIAKGDLKEKIKCNIEEVKQEGEKEFQLYKEELEKKLKDEELKQKAKEKVEEKTVTKKKKK